MFYAAFNDAQGERQAYIYNSWEVYHNDTFSPDCEKIYLIEFKATWFERMGKRYGLLTEFRENAIC